MDFSVTTDGPRMVCRITTDRALSRPVFCYSGLAPTHVVTGGTLVRKVAGFGEVQLDDLAAGDTVEVVLAADIARHTPVNRAWLPLRPYLRVAGETIDLPALPAGVTYDTIPDVPPHGGLRLVPRPSELFAARASFPPRGLATEDTAFASIDALACRHGLPRLVDAGGLPLTLVEDHQMPDGAYRMEIAPHGVTVTAAGGAGRRHAAVTWLTLMTTHADGMPCGIIEDTPRFNWRGQHLDCARHFFEVETILQLLDLMALMKLNVFHWHAADDEAFRYALPSLPELAEKTALRGEGQLVPGLFGGGTRAGGYYSRADMERVIAHAADLGIEVMPEIEVPAHSCALAKVYPGVRDPGDNGAEMSVQGYQENTINPAQPATWEMLEKMVADMATLFPGPVLHLGCDEMPADAWEGSPMARELMEREGLAGPKDLQAWTMQRLNALLKRHGKRAAAWEEAAQAEGIGSDAVLFSWSGQGPGIEAIARGFDVVMCPAQHVYLDMAHTDDPDDWGAAWAAFVGLEDTVRWDPVPPEARGQPGQVIGVAGAFWGEFTTEDAELWPMIVPRILGVATMAWEADPSDAAATIAPLASAYRPLFERMGIAKGGNSPMTTV